MMTVRERQTTTSEHNLTVALRIRPLLPHEAVRGHRVAYKANDKCVVLVEPTYGDGGDVLRARRVPERRYEFDWAFDKDASQEEVYVKTTRDLVESVLNGFNGTIFAYGATGSGKTYTMTGNSENPGIMARALDDLFSAVDYNKDTLVQDMSLSFAEIYNDNIRDLLNPTSGFLDLREDSRGNHQVVGLSEVTITNSHEVGKLLAKANRQRTQESTSANRTSSRSHALLQVNVKLQKRLSRPSEPREIRTGRLYLVDLAGSERASQTQNTGKRLVEGAHINKSLLALGNCINALADRSVRYVNYRDSKLTRLLKVPLSGNCRTVMIAHINPTAPHFEESRKTLAYASRAKNITNKVHSNVTSVTHHVAQYQMIISELRLEIERLQDRIQEQAAQATRNDKVKTQAHEKGISEKKLGDAELKRLKAELMSSFNQQMQLRRELVSVDNNLIGFDVEFERLGALVNEWESELSKNGSPAEMPTSIQHAWDEVRHLESEEKRFLQIRLEVQKRLEDSRQRIHALMESLPGKASTEEQRELLGLLTRVHQLEVENVEMQASQLLREHELRQREFMILRYDRQRQLCEEIITKQRAIIDDISSGRGQDKDTSRELSELYSMYQQEMQEILGGRNSVIKYLHSANLRGQPSLPSLRPLGSGSSLLDLSSKNGDSPPFGRRSNLNQSTGDPLFFHTPVPTIVEGRRRGPVVLSPPVPPRISALGANRSSSRVRTGVESLSEPVTPVERARTRLLPSLVNSDRVSPSPTYKANTPNPTMLGTPSLPVTLEATTDLMEEHLMEKNVIKASVGSTRGPTWISLDQEKENNNNKIEASTLSSGGPVASVTVPVAAALRPTQLPVRVNPQHQVAPPQNHSQTSRITQQPAKRHATLNKDTSRPRRHKKQIPRAVKDIKAKGTSSEKVASN